MLTEAESLFDPKKPKVVKAKASVTKKPIVKAVAKKTVATKKAA